MITQITKTAYFIIPLIFILGVYFFYSIKKLKEIDSKKLAILYTDLTLEKDLALKLKNTSNEIDKMEYSLSKKIQKIKVSVLNINFSLKEIFN